MINAIKASLTRNRSRIRKIFGSSLPPASRANTRPVAEEPGLYKTGGFHPIFLGDRLGSDQYTILRKLGYGQYSTVWLELDLSEVYSKLTGGADMKGAHDIFEREILNRILEVSEQSFHEGRNHVSGLLDHFKHTGPNGDHVCFVFDVLGHHMDFHSATEYGIIHTDIKPTNILLELANPDRTISQYLERVPERTGLKDGDVVPLREVITTSLVSDMERPRIRIIDFGVASWRRNRLSDRIQPLALRAREVTIGTSWDIGVDIWSLGCLVIEFVQGIVLFSGEASQNGTWSAEDNQLARISEVLGPFPLHFIEAGRRRHEFFDKDGNLLRIPNLKPTSLECMINGTTEPFLKPRDTPDAEVPVFIDFLKGMLEVDPVARKSASELLQHEWINLESSFQV